MKRARLHFAHLSLLLLSILNVDNANNRIEISAQLSRTTTLVRSEIPEQIKNIILSCNLPTSTCDADFWLFNSS
jgi:hypothetical protein